MKNLLFIAFLLAMSTSIFAQKMDKDRYTISGGLLGAMNYDRFYIANDNTADIAYEPSIGWSAGGWLSLPLSHTIYLEPEVMYSLYDYSVKSGGTALLPYGNISYISIPVLLKFDLSPAFALTWGPQVDIIASLSNTPSSAEQADFESTSFSVNAGLEIMPHAPVTIFVRYMHGLTNMDAEDVGGDSDYFNSNAQLGIKLKLFGKRIPADTDADGTPDESDACPTVAGLERYQGCPIPDTDMDGVNDEEDKCVDVVGLTKYMGCPIPDTDKDGMNDEVDKCPTVAGLSRYNGCPIPDTDGDTFNDEVDKCPSVAGVSKYGGCPIPDTDGDGVNDETDKCPSLKGLAKFGGCPDRDNDGIVDGEDHCPDIVGPADNFGCPKIESAKFTTQRIQFITGSATLTADAKKDITEGAKLLNSDDFKMLKIEIRGHTDNTGKEASNQVLSEKRAKAVMAELVKNGVSADRMTAIGFGQTMPIADNATAEGRALNRRVAFDVRQ